jgi:hypothetical protein
MAVVRASIYNNDIINNTADQGGGIHLVNTGHKINIRNNIIYNNATVFSTMPDSFALHGYGDTVVYEYNWSKNSYTSDLHTGAVAVVVLGDTVKNITGTNPGIVAPTLTHTVTESALSANFSLLPTSPCINKGINTGITAGALDYLRAPRINGSAVDIGACEYVVSVYTELPVADAKIAVYPNPASNQVVVTTPESNGTITLVNISGQVVLEKNVSAALTSIDISRVQRGMYFVVWNTTDGAKIMEKLIAE